MPMKSRRTLILKFEKIVLINANLGTTLLCAFCSSKSYPTVGMPTAGALKHTDDEPTPDTDLLILFKKNQISEGKKGLHMKIVASSVFL